MLDAPVVPMFLGAVATVAASPPFRSLTVGVQFILSYYTEYLAELSQISVRVGLSRSFSHFFSGAGRYLVSYLRSLSLQPGWNFDIEVR
jgi:hypothetical protein